MKMRELRFTWLWPMIIVLSTIAAGLVTFVFSQTPLRPVIIMWFLFVCPGITVVRFFRLTEAAIEWTLALALSFVIDAFVATVLLYAGWWSPIRILDILIILCFCGAIVQIVTIPPTSAALIEAEIPTVIVRRYYRTHGRGSTHEG